MTYCKECAGKKGWPFNPWSFITYGPCEECGKTRECVDVKSSLLPLPKNKSS